MNTELKQYVFAGYIGQNVLRVSQDAIVTQKIDYWFIKQFLKTGFLELRPLSAITDSEAVEVAKLRLGSPLPIQSTKTHIDWITQSCVPAYEYLQQRGFALPVWFKGETYTVDRLVYLGIYKLTE